MIFTPVSRYIQALDVILCVTEDVSYRSQTVNAYLEVLWHPQERYLVGVKILHAKKIHKSLYGWPIDRPLSLMVAVCAALLEGQPAIDSTAGVALKDFFQQHKDTVDISPMVRRHIEFTLIPQSSPE
jgi:hypothetical protein